MDGIRYNIILIYSIKSDSNWTHYNCSIIKIFKKLIQVTCN